jgi:uncharacterized protein YjbI with pentapeptide repeats
MMRQKAPPSSFQELLDRYQHGERDFAGVELDADPDSDLSGVCLDGADFSHAFLIASFRGASLRGARFYQANLKTCDFREADLRDTDFRGAGLCSASFDGAKLDGSNFTGAYIHSYELQEGERPGGDPAAEYSPATP